MQSSYFIGDGIIVDTNFFYPIKIECFLMRMPDKLLILQSESKRCTLEKMNFENFSKWYFMFLF